MSRIHTESDRKPVIPWAFWTFWLVLATSSLGCGAAETEPDAADAADVSETPDSGNDADDGWATAVEALYLGSTPFGLEAEAPDYLSWEGDRLAEWMMPFESDRESGAADHADYILAIEDFGAAGPLVLSSFDEPHWDEFFRGRVAKYMGDLLSASPHADAFLGLLIVNEFQAFIDQFGELINEAPPFESEGAAAGYASSTRMEVVTTLPVWMVTGDAEAEHSDDALPVWLLPLYERYLVQHEFGHVFHFTMGDQAELDGVDLTSAVSELYWLANMDDLHISCYGKDDEREFWAEATAAYLAPVAIVALNSSDVDPSCGVGLTPEAEALVLENGFLRMTGAELIGEMHGELFDLLEAMYGPPPEFSVRETRREPRERD